MKKWIIGIALLLVAPFIFYKYVLVSDITVRVADINKGEFVSLCIVGEDAASGCDEYTNVDDMWRFKLNSGKIRSRLALAETDATELTVRVQGIRWTWFSIRKNITTIVE